MINYKIGIGTCEKYKLVGVSNADLKVLDSYTSRFKNEQEYKNYLISHNIIKKDLFGKLQIFYTYKDKVKVLPILYSDMFNYLDPSLVKCELLKISSDIDTLEDLIAYYSADKYDNSPIFSIITEIFSCVKGIRQSNNYHFYEDALRDSLEHLYNIIVYRFDNGKRKLNYRGLRELAIIVYVMNNKNYVDSTKVQDIPIYEQMTIEGYIKK